MKVLGLILSILLITSPVLAVDYVITLTDEQNDAISVLTTTDQLSTTPQQWIQNAATNKANQMIERLVKDHSDKQPGKMTKAEKKALINTIDLQKEKDKRKGK